MACSGVLRPGPAAQRRDSRYSVDADGLSRQPYSSSASDPCAGDSLVLGYHRVLY